MNQDRQKWINLIFAGHSPDLAYLQHPEHSIQEYEETLKKQDFKNFSDSIYKDFIENLDLRLMGDLYKCSQDMQIIKASDPNYPKIQKNYLEMLKITAPIVDRIKSLKYTAHPGINFDDIEFTFEG